MVLKLGHVEKWIRKCLESSEIWLWRRTQKISWTDCVRSEVLNRVKERGTSYIL